MESNEDINAWVTLKYANTQQTGPRHAIEAEAAVLEEKGIDYLIEDYKPYEYDEAPEGVEVKVRKPRRTVNDLEVNSDGSK